jgi:hypothetical protein
VDGFAVSIALKRNTAKDLAVRSRASAATALRGPTSSWPGPNDPAAMRYVDKSTNCRIYLDGRANGALQPAVSHIRPLVSEKGRQQRTTAVARFQTVCEASPVTCPVCRQRRARRSCPALHQTICSVCCGTKRLVEIACPDDCPHLASAREHPPAVVKRQQEEDVAVLLPGIQHLTERQYQLFFLFHGTIARHVPEGFARLADEDVAQAAASLAATLETSSRGVIYEHKPQSTTAQRLMNELTAFLAQIRSQGATVSDGEAAIVLRAIDEGARDVGRRTSGGPSAYLELMSRLLQLRRGTRPPDTASPSTSSLILP